MQAEVIGPEGRIPVMFQDCDRGVSRWLANTPDARRHAREAVEAIAKEKAAGMAEHAQGAN